MAAHGHESRARDRHTQTPANGRRYEPGCSGFVVRHEIQPRANRPAFGVWWHGPGTVFRTWSGLRHAVAVFRTRQAARAAFGAGARLPAGFRLQRVAEAEAEEAARLEASDRTGTDREAK